MANTISFIHTSIEGVGKYHGEIWIMENAIDWRKAHEQKAYRVKFEDFKNFMETNGKKVKPRTK
ncbi:MAG: hypothetical protein OXE56_09735 [Gammaproteobacteria bacterium]|nr:hypothetical protein [Gammaproteobacteria bacterium]